MKSIEITTAHNIVVTYELASPMQRFLASLIDVMIQGLYLMLIAALFSSYLSLLYIFGFLVLFFYHLAFEVFNEGQSLGKKLVKTRVVSAHGMTPSTEDFFLRWVFRLIDITLSLGSIGLISMLASPKNQRLGDLLAQTTVVRLEASRGISLKNIEKLSAPTDEIIFPEVVQYADKDMLLVKEALQRMRNNPNLENRKVVRDLREKISNDLGVDVSPGESVDFLYTVLKDYIVLTR